MEEEKEGGKAKEGKMYVLQEKRESTKICMEAVRVFIF
jgi:hypothetical protein